MHAELASASAFPPRPSAPGCMRRTGAGGGRGRAGLGPPRCCRSACRAASSSRRRSARAASASRCRLPHPAELTRPSSSWWHARLRAARARTRSPQPSWNCGDKEPRGTPSSLSSCKYFGCMRNFGLWAARACQAHRATACLSRSPAENRRRFSSRARVRSHCRFRNRGNDSLSKSGIK